MFIFSGMASTTFEMLRSEVGWFPTFLRLCREKKSKVSKVWKREENPLIPLLERVLTCRSYRYVVQLLRRHHWITRQVIYPIEEKKVEASRRVRIRSLAPAPGTVISSLRTSLLLGAVSALYRARNLVFSSIWYRVIESLKRRQAFRINTPSSMMVVGPSECGKTVFTTKLLLRNLDLFETSPAKICYCYGAWQKGFRPMKKHGVKFHEGIPDSELLPMWFSQGG